MFYFAWCGELRNDQTNFLGDSQSCLVDGVVRQLIRSTIDGLHETALYEVPKTLTDGRTPQLVGFFEPYGAELHSRDENTTIAAVPQRISVGEEDRRGKKNHNDRLVGPTWRSSSGRLFTKRRNNRRREVVRGSNETFVRWRC